MAEAEGGRSTMPQTPLIKQPRIVSLPLGKRQERQLSGPKNDDMRVNILEVLEADFSQYYIAKAPGVQWVNITALPSFLRTTLDKLKAKVDLPREPGIQPTLCCCISHGLPILQAHEQVVALHDVKRRFNEMEQAGTPSEEFIAQYFRAIFDVGIPKGKRQNVAVPDDLKRQIQGLAFNLGTTESSLAVLSAYAVLSTQSEVPTNYQGHMSDKVEEFFQLVGMKVVGAEALVSSL
jgi:hypothetical protein